MRSLLLLCAIASASALVVAPPKELKGAPTARVYVMNLPENPERCECMQSQLSKSPFPVTRFMGANHHKPKSLRNCSEVQNMKHQTENVPAFLTCTNYMIWKQAVKDDDADFIIIFEDDATLAHKGGHQFWSKVQDMLAGCNNFDYLSVDTFGGITDPQGVIGASLFESNKTTDRSNQCSFEPLQGWGAHMQIIKKTALPKLIKTVKHGQWGAMDHWSDFTSSIRKFHWRAGIVQQASQDTHKVSKLCSSKHMGESTLGNFKGEKKPVDMAETKTQVFQCHEDKRAKKIVEPTVKELDDKFNAEEETKEATESTESNNWLR
jgi:hypothetical protein